MLGRTCIFAVGLLVAFWVPAFGDDKATAEALFLDAKQLVSAGDYAAACPKFEASYRADPGLGALVNLADCHEHLGKLATAWAEYREAEDIARKREDQKREAFAHDHAATLEPRLIKLRLDPPAAPITGLAVHRDGADVTAILGTAVPVDPGSHTIEASAPGFVSWTMMITASGEGTTTPLLIPALVAVVVKPEAVPIGVSTPAPPPRAPRAGHGFGGELRGGKAQTASLYPDASNETGNPAAFTAGYAYAVGGFFDLALGSRWRLRLGARLRQTVLDYEIHDGGGGLQCACPSSIVTVFGGPAVSLETTFYRGESVDAHWIVGGAFGAPLTQGRYELDNMGTSVPGITGALDVEVGFGVQIGGFFVNLVGQVDVNRLSNTFDNGTTLLLWLSAGWSSMRDQ